jgi:hypothetical protein
MKTFEEIKKMEIKGITERNKKYAIEYLTEKTVEDIKAIAKTYDPKEKSANAYGSTSRDIMRGDLGGVRAAIRRVAHELVNVPVAATPNPTPAASNPKPATPAGSPEPVRRQRQAPVNPPVDNKITDQQAKELKDKIKFVSDLLDKLYNGASSVIYDDYEAAVMAVEEMAIIVSSVQTIGLSEEDISLLNDTCATINKFLDRIKKFNPANCGYSEEKLKAVLKRKDDVMKLGDLTSSTQQLAAHSMGGFNIGNFVHQQQQGPVAGTPVQQAANLLPHQTCGLTNDQIVDEVNKHFKLMHAVPAWPLYDLLHNNILSVKMRELGSKQRPNNPYLTQVVLTEYFDQPEYTNNYNLCFTIPCKDKGYVIMVLYNTNMVIANNRPYYPLNILKAKLRKN